ncbi:MAG: hypothetical protein AB7E37_05940 [Candidatus Altimarinota bacterium]
MKKILSKRFTKQIEFYKFLEAIGDDRGIAHQINLYFRLFVFFIEEEEKGNIKSSNKDFTKCTMDLLVLLQKSRELESYSLFEDKVQKMENYIFEYTLFGFIKLFSSK